MLRYLQIVAVAVLATVFIHIHAAEINFNLGSLGSYGGYSAPAPIPIPAEKVVEYYVSK